MSTTVSIPISALPKTTRDSVITMDLDRDGNGELDVTELCVAFDDIEKKRLANKSMKRIIIAMVVSILLLTSCVFVASLTAGRISKQFDVNQNTGVVFSHDGKQHTILKTSEADLKQNDVSIVELSNDELGALKQIVLADGDIRFVVKGYSRDPFGTEVMILIEGGSIVYDKDGIIEANGFAKTAFEAAYGVDVFDDADRNLVSFRL
jgi:hypothetical protein